MIYIVYILISLAIIFFIYLQWQKSIIFQKKFFRNNALYDNDYKFLTVITNDNIKLEGCIYTPKNYKSTILYFGGRGQDSVGLLPKLSEVFFDIRVITFNYRGYGKSQGEPSEQKLYDDALEVYKKVYKHYGDVVVLGFSLGSSIASYLASKTDIKKLFIVGAFSSLNDLIKDKYGFRFPFLKYGFYTCKYLQESDAKVYIFVSKDDNVVPFNDSFRLENCPKNLEKFVVVSGVNHIELLWHKDVIKEIKNNLV